MHIPGRSGEHKARRNESAVCENSPEPPEFEVPHNIQTEDQVCPEERRQSTDKREYIGMWWLIRTSWTWLGARN